MGNCGPIPDAERAAAKATHEKQDVNREFVSQFTAPASGELFLYVNDAILAFPFLPAMSCFYNNNSGAAQVTVKRTPVPKP